MQLMQVVLSSNVTRTVYPNTVRTADVAERAYAAGHFYHTVMSGNGGGINYDVVIRVAAKTILPVLGAVQPVSKYAVLTVKNEQLQIMNAVPTAEGAIAIAMDELPVTLFESNAVVIGYGRVAKLLAHRLTALGAKVTVCARREDDRAYASAFGCNAVDFSLLGSALETADVVFNSVPQHIIGEELYPRINKNTPVIDLASRPGGLDFERAKQYGLNVIWALSLPGKAAPVTAGRIIAATLTKLLEGSENNA